MNRILQAKNLCKSYALSKENRQQVLKDINLSVSQGEFVAVMGPSGSGKSTLLYSISSMDRASGGSIKFFGKEMTSLSEEELAKIRLRSMGFVFQQSNLLKNLTILDNIILPGYMAKRDSRERINKRAGTLMEKVGIADLASKDITQVSGGQLQRAAICRALINEPDILFGDEPTGALNSKATGEVMELFSTIHASGTTILLVTHDAKVAARSERVVFMADGSVAGEMELGRYSGEKAAGKDREARLQTWLDSMGF